MKEIDARNMDCPAPVIKTKKAIESEGLTELKVLLNSESSKQNVSRLAETMGFSFTMEEKGDDAILTMRKGDAPVAVKEQAPDQENITVFISSEKMGSGDDALGEKLMHAFLSNMKDARPLPARILFVNGGVRITTGESPMVPYLRELETMGIEIYTCGACLEHFGIMDQLKVGQVGNMLSTTEALFQADKVVKL